MTIKHLGRWESLEMSQRYTTSVTFEDIIRFHTAPLGFSPLRARARDKAEPQPVLNRYLSSRKRGSASFTPP